MEWRGGEWRVVSDSYNEPDKYPTLTQALSLTSDRGSWLYFFSVYDMYILLHMPMC